MPTPANHAPPPVGVSRAGSPSYHNYRPAVRVEASSELLFTSGLNGFMPDGTIAADFDGQVDQVWRQLEEILATAGMDASHLVHLRIYLASAADDPSNVEALRRHLGAHASARTVVVQTLLDPRWLVELEAVAARIAPIAD